MAKLICPICGRELVVIFSEEHRLFLADRKFPVGTILLDDKNRPWEVLSAEEYWAGWKHKVDKYLGGEPMTREEYLRKILRRKTL